MPRAKKVVCIGDHPQEMIDQVKLMVNRKDIEFTGATGEREGLEAIRRIKPDLVLLNLSATQHLDGWKFYQQMKADKELKDVPVLGVTLKDLCEMARLV